MQQNINEAVLELTVEELPEQTQNVSDCLSSASSIGTAGTCVASAFCAGSIISCGASEVLN